MRGDWPASIFATLLALTVLFHFLRDVFRSIRAMFEDLMETIQALASIGGVLIGLAIAGYFTLQIVKVRTVGRIEVSKNENPPVRRTEIHWSEENHLPS